MVVGDRISEDGDLDLAELYDSGRGAETAAADKYRHECGGLRQICKVCWKIDKFDFTVNDAKWAEVVPQEYQDRVVCLGCFDKFAREKRIDYAKNITTLYFAGDQASLSFRVRTRRAMGGC